MHINISSVIAFMLISILLVSCCQKPKVKDQSVELVDIEDTIRSCIGWLKDKDFNLLYRVVAKDENYISVQQHFSFAN